jgi:intein-encoded DNA endonuclease-like protein
MTELEQKIIELRKEGLSYRNIQIKLGNPSKKFIRETLLQYTPDLVGDIVKNYNKLEPKW